jgi:hypothetical protein
MAEPLREIREVPAASRFQTGVLTLLVRALSAQSLVWAALLGAMAVWGVTMWKPEIPRIAAAVGYTVLVLGPVLFRRSA